MSNECVRQAPASLADPKGTFRRGKSREYHSLATVLTCAAGGAKSYLQAGSHHGSASPAKSKTHRVQRKMSEKMSESIVIVGAGQAAIQAVQSLRAEGFTGSLTLIGDEAYAPYQRPPLSKAYLLGALERARLFLKSDAYYGEAGCELLLNTNVAAIDRGQKNVELSDGRKLSYDKLLLTTGARVRKLNCPGADLPGVFYLKTIADVDLLQAEFLAGKRIAIVGGGYIGLEVAAVAAKRGLHATVFEAMDRLMARAVSPALSAFYADEHSKAGVTLKLNTGVEAIEGNGKVERVRAGGQTYDADMVLVGIGVLANDELARAAGLKATDGIVVDRNARTSDPDIFAGDCTRHYGREGVELRLECVQNAIDQAKHACPSNDWQTKDL